MNKFKAKRLKTVYAREGDQEVDQEETPEREPDMVSSGDPLLDELAYYRNFHVESRGAMGNRFPGLSMLIFS